jgi:opacity protein-like surface antigen
MAGSSSTRPIEGWCSASAQPRLIACWSRPKLPPLALTQMATFRAIAGVPIGSFLPYVTGGLALGSTSFSQTIQVPTQPGTCVCWAGQSSGVKAGWVAGAGLQQALTARISVKVEYLYSDLGSRQFTTFGVLNGNPGLDFTHTARFTSQTVKVGLNFGL